MTSRDEALRALEKRLREEAGQHEINALEADSVGATEAACGHEWKSELKYGLADELAALLSSRQEVAPVAYCDPSDPRNSHAFAWPGTFREERHATPLYTSTDQTSDARDAQDAARYRFLIPALYRDDFTVGEAAIQLHTVGPCPTVDDVAAAIDAAMEAK